MQVRLPTALAMVFMLVSAAAATAFQCPSGREGELFPVRWSAEAANSQTIVRLGITNPSDKGVKMVEAGVWFIDPLGRSASNNDRGAQIDPDLTIAAGGSIISQAEYSSLSRLVGAAFEDFTPHICTTAILYDDGTTARF